MSFTAVGAFRSLRWMKSCRPVSGLAAEYTHANQCLYIAGKQTWGSHMWLSDLRIRVVWIFEGGLETGDAAIRVAALAKQPVDETLTCHQRPHILHKTVLANDEVRVCEAVIFFDWPSNREAVRQPVTTPLQVMVGRLRSPGQGSR